jgi:uncharacterized membrane protein (UPF0127 family)
MQTNLIIAGILVVISFLIVLSTKIGMKHSTFVQVKVGSKTVNAEIADTFAKQMKGLMGVKSLPEDQGMLFVFDHPDIYKFWMFNTSIPLDMIWIDSNKTIVYIQQNAQPCFLLNCTSYSPNQNAQYVLEVNGNYTAENKISAGDKVEFKLS